ncbi:MAG: RNA-binding cell elongation regulator Jag/EloR [Clostridia bacterium]
MNSMEITAVSFELALAEAMEKLNVTEEQLDYITLKTSGLIRKKTTYLFSTKKDTADLAQEFVDGIIANMHLDIVALVTEDETAINVSLSGNDTSTLIGYRGDVLDSLQYLTLLVCNKNNPENKRLIIDGESYRERRTETLSRLAKKLAFKASKTNTPISLEPMNPFERRIIHAALSDDKFVTTESEGDEPNRFVTIKPNKRNFDRPRSNYGDRPYNSSRDREYSPRPRTNYNSQNTATYTDTTESDYDAPKAPTTTLIPNTNTKESVANREQNYSRPERNSYDKPRVERATSDNNASPAEETTEKDMYNAEYSKTFKKTGVSKMRSFGAPKSKYF